LLSVTVAAALREGVELLERDHVPAARLTAEVLLAHALACDRVRLYSHPERELTPLQQLHYGRFLYERLRRKPTQYITGRQEFYGREFLVTPEVLIPRPETEHVVEAALRLAAGAVRILDVGTGSGCLAVTLQKEWPHTQVFASDSSRSAIGVARENSRRLEAGVRLFCADLLTASPAGSLDLIVCNPPYIPSHQAAGLPAEVRDWEPPSALFGDLYRPLIEDAARVLRPRGWLVVEIPYNGRARIEALAGPAWEPAVAQTDLAGLDRVLAWRRR
jgi:release factor glutamine methyltransferase